MDISSLLRTVAALRGPEGCPWDKEQNHQSLRKYLLEEAYEVLEVLDQIEKNDTLAKNHGLREQFRDELGDLLFQVLLHAEMASEQTNLSFAEIAKGLEEKLVRRHPHVFAKKQNLSTQEITVQWEETKQKEKKRDSALDDIPPSLPALQKAEKVIERVSKKGFQWPDLQGPLDKVAEELAELAEEIQKWQKNPSAEQHKKLEAELGDLLFSVCNIGFFLQVNPESALRSMLSRFESRFRHVEKKVLEQGKNMKDCSLDELDEHWAEAKKKEKK